MRKSSDTWRGELLRKAYEDGYRIVRAELAANLKSGPYAVRECFLPSWNNLGLRACSFLHALCVAGEGNAHPRPERRAGEHRSAIHASSPSAGFRLAGILDLARNSAVEDMCKMRDLLSIAAHQTTRLVIGVR
jgi:hypothetical protein